MSKIEEIEGIGPSYGEKLRMAGVSSVEDLLQAGAEKSGRKSLSDKTGITENLILEWVNRADLTRVKGVSTQYADLLEASGVDSIPELAQRNAENLLAKMKEVNTEKKLVRQLPGIASVEKWVSNAKDLPRVVKY